MKTCGVCRTSVKVAREILVDFIGKPPVLISKLLLKIATNVDNKLASNDICRKCTGKLSKYYKASLVAEAIEQEFVDLIKKPLTTHFHEIVDKTVTVKTETEFIKESDYDNAIEAQNPLSTDNYVATTSNVTIPANVKIEDWPLQKVFCSKDKKKPEDAEEEEEEPEDALNSGNDFDCNDNASDSANEMETQADHERDSSRSEVCPASFLMITHGEDKDKIEMPTKSEATEVAEPIAAANIEGRSDAPQVTDAIEKSAEQKPISGPPAWTAKLGKTRPSGVKCDCCDRIFENHKTLEAHRKAGDFPGYVCDQCGITLFSSSGFITHCKSHRAVKEHECPVCGASFHRKAKLNHHMAWHTGEKKFQCEICAKCFVHRVALTKHRHIHSDATRRNECKECGSKFRTKTHLTRHMNTHTGAKPHNCPYCDKNYSQVYNLRAHIKQHENPTENWIMRFKCKKCLKNFSREDKYEDHCKRNDCLNNKS